MKILLFALFIIGIRCSPSSDDSLSSDVSWKIVAFLLLSGILIMLFIIVCLVWKLFKLKNHMQTNAEPVTPSKNEHRPLQNPNVTKRSTNNQENEVEWGESLIVSNSEDLDLEPNYEIDARNLELKETIDQGLFSRIQKGTLKMAKPKSMKEKAKKLDVCAKGAINQQDKTQQQMILDELKVMCEITKHTNLIALVGFVVNPNQMLIVSESVDWNLLKYLKDRRGMFETNSESSDSIENVDEQNGFYNVDYPEISEEFEPLSFVDLLSFAYQIANGMRHLASLSYVHRQLALRNIYITHDKTIRIGELGLARRHGNNEYYRIMNKNMPLPFHWMAPETFKDHKFTEKSDVWSFAVCLWELFTLGRMPYKDVEDVLTFLSRGKRLAQPEYCNENIYQLMKSCWDMEAANRPSFTHCAKFFEEQLEKQDTEAFAELFQKLEIVSMHQEQLQTWTNGARFDDDSGDSV